MIKLFTTTALAALALTSVPVSAVQLVVSSYDMPNGSGQAIGGTYNYWDLSYTGAGSKTTDGAALSGGRGDLTDGYIETQSWNNVENVAGTGPYVGWYSINVPNPVVTFHFAGAPTIQSINISMDNSGIGGVFAPQSILIDGVATPFTAPSGVGTVSFSGLSLAGGTHTIQFVQQPASWVFVSEAGFSGAVPEPASWALLIVGFGMIGAASRRRRAGAVTAA